MNKVLILSSTLLILFFICSCNGNSQYNETQGEAAFTEAVKPLDPEKNYSNPDFTESDYSNLLDKMKGLYEVETDRSLLQLRSGNNLHVVMLENGKPNSNNKMIVRNCQIGPNYRALVFMGEDKNGEAMVVSIEMETEDDLIVKLSTQGQALAMRGQLKKVM